jgi:ADP-ribose pyrophosphatase YjhB (NUDIX family)
MTADLPATVIGCSNLIVRDGRFLLVQESKERARSLFNLPAGKPELDETLAEAAVREAREETGLDVEVEHLVAIYHCPRTSEGVGVVNFVFRSEVTGGTLRTSAEHPAVGYFSREEIAELGRAGRLRGVHVELAVDQCAAGVRLPMDIVQLIPCTPPPAPSPSPSQSPPRSGSEHEPG